MSVPMPEIPAELAEMLEVSWTHTAAITEAQRLAWRHGDEEEWGLDQDEGVLQFQFADGTVVSAEAQIIGTLDTKAGTWMWSWNNPSIDPLLQADAEQVCAFGEEKGFAALTQPSWPCDEEMAWRMTALALTLCDRQGVYRGPAGTTYVYMTFGEVSIDRLDGPL